MDDFVNTVQEEFNFPEFLNELCIGSAPDETYPSPQTNSFHRACQGTDTPLQAGINIPIVLVKGRFSDGLQRSVMSNTCIDDNQLEKRPASPLSLIHDSKRQKHCRSFSPQPDRHAKNSSSAERSPRVIIRDCKIIVEEDCEEGDKPLCNMKMLKNLSDEHNWSCQQHQHLSPKWTVTEDHSVSQSVSSAMLYTDDLGRYYVMEESQKGMELRCRDRWRPCSSQPSVAQGIFHAPNVDSGLMGVYPEMSGSPSVAQRPAHHSHSITRSSCMAVLPMDSPCAAQKPSCNHSSFSGPRINPCSEVYFRNIPEAVSGASLDDVAEGDFEPRGKHGNKGDFEPRGKHSNEGDFEPRGKHANKGDFEPRGKHGNNSGNPGDCDSLNHLLPSSSAPLTHALSVENTAHPKVFDPLLQSIPPKDITTVSCPTESRPCDLAIEGTAQSQNLNDLRLPLPAKMSIQGTLNTATLCPKALFSGDKQFNEEVAEEVAERPMLSSSGKALPYSSGYFAEVVCNISNLRIEGERDAMALKVTSDNKLEAACPQNICPDNHLLGDAAYPPSATSPKDISPVNYLLEEVGCFPTSNPEERPLEGRGLHLPSRRASMEVAELSGGSLYYLSRPASKEVTEFSGGRLCRLHHPDSMSEGAVHFLQHLGSVPTAENVDDTEIFSAGTNIRKAKASKELLVHHNEWLDMQTCKIEQLLLAFSHSSVDGGSSSAGLESEGDGMAFNSEQQQPIDPAGHLIVPYGWHSHQDGHESWKSSLHNEITQLCGTATEFLQLRQLQGRLSRQQSKIDQCLSVLCLASQRLTEIDDRILSKQAKLLELVAEVAALQQCDEIMIDNNDYGGGIECLQNESTEQPGGQELHDPMLLQNVDEEEAEVGIPVKEWSIVQNKIASCFDEVKNKLTWVESCLQRDLQLLLLQAKTDVSEV